jgi:hypothetical protein
MEFISVFLIRLSRCFGKLKLDVSPDDSELGTGTVKTPIGSPLRMLIAEENEVFTTPPITKK